MPYRAWKKSRSLVLTCIQVLISFAFIGFIAVYVNSIPENESTWMISRMLLVPPIFCLICQFICFGVYYVIKQIRTHFRELSNIKNGI
jgi:hypothetical protein